MKLATKYSFSILFLILFSLVLSCVSSEFSLLSQRVITEDLVLDKSSSNVAQRLEPLFKLTGLAKPHSLEEAISLSQAKWLRPKNLERWELGAYLQLDSSQEQKAREIFSKNLQMNIDIKPSRENYDYILVLGATVKTMRSRFAYLLSLFEEGELKAKNVVFLVGERPISKELETREILLGNYDHNLKIREDWVHKGALPKTETEAARLVVDQSELSSKLERSSILFVNTSMQKKKDGKMRRPNTSDTVLAWLKTKPEGKSLLAISSNPYCGYQHAALRKLLPESWVLETVGKGANDFGKIELYFDSLARWLYQYKKS